MAYNDEQTFRKKKATALLFLLQLRENDEQLLKAQRLLLQVKMFSFHFVNQPLSSGNACTNKDYNSYFKHFSFVDMIGQFFCLVS